MLLFLALQLAPAQAQDAPLPEGAVLRCVGKGAGSLFFAAFAPDARTLVTGVRGGFAQKWDAAGKELFRVDPGSGCLSLAVSADGKRAAAGDDGGFTIRVWNLDTGKVLADLDEHVDQARSLAFSPDGRLLASGG